MIKIELEFATGAEARQALTELLGGNLTVVKGEDIAIRNEKITENFEAPKMEVVQEEKPVEESTTPKKRRTKAEIAAEEAAAIAARQETEQQSEDVQVEEKPATEAVKEPAVTVKMLQEKAIELVRGQKKELVTAVLKKFGADSIAQADKTPLKPEHYGDVMDELNKL